MDLPKNRIKELRDDRDLRQSDVSFATGIDQRTLSNYETGKTNPDSVAIIKLANFFGVTCDYLLGVSDINIKSSSIIADEIDDMKKHLDLIKKYVSSSRMSQRYQTKE